jgi:hypothetical protein
MGMVVQGVVGVVALVGVSTNTAWVTSSIYPYSIKAPTTFRHVVLPTVTGQNEDLYAPPIGSAATSVTVYADRSGSGEGAIEYFVSHHGQHVHQSGTVSIMGKRIAVECADFNSYGTRYRQEEVTFSAGGYFWRLTASYELRYSGRYRVPMLRMLGSFRLR